MKSEQYFKPVEINKYSSKEPVEIKKQLTSSEPAHLWYDAILFNSITPARREFLRLRPAARPRSDRSCFVRDATASSPRSGRPD
jgi:hypothetical protein